MIYEINDTHDPALRCRVASAHAPSADFPIQNLPLGVFADRKVPGPPHIGIAIGDRILDLWECARRDLLAGLHTSWVEACTDPSLNRLMASGRECWSALRMRASLLLRADIMRLPKHEAQVEASLLPASRAQMVLPAATGDYTDFYASIDHARNVGSMFRPANPLLPNYRYMPIGYHGRASSIVVSGTPVVRPLGQRPGEAEMPVWGPSRQLDYELELGAFIGPGNDLGSPVALREAEERIFGLVLLNDWSARDIQKWEYQPLGPFLAKSFATSISPWVVTMEALAPFRAPARARTSDDPPLFAYLNDPEDRRAGGLDLELAVCLGSERMRKLGEQPALMSTANGRVLYWTLAQLIAHHTGNGCNLRPGDLLATGTISGAGSRERGCLLELSEGGGSPVPLPGGETRSYLEDGDEVLFCAHAERAGAARIGFGVCTGVIRPGPLAPDFLPGSHS